MEMQKNKITIAVIGCGRFSKNFVPLFKAHPYVEKVYVCDKRAERAQARHGCRVVYAAHVFGGVT